MRSRLKSISIPPYFIAKIAVAFTGGILMGLTPAPVEAFPLAWIALVPLWVLIVNKTVRESLFYAIAWGVGYHGFAVFWITGIHPMTWMGVPWLGSLAIALFCWLFLIIWGVILFASWTALFVFLTQFIQFNAQKNRDGTGTEIDLFKMRGLRVLTGVALWCFLEAIWSAGPLWWTSLSYTQSPHNLFILQLSQFSGPSTVTALIVAVNGLIAEFILSYFAFNASPRKKENSLFLKHFFAITYHKDISSFSASTVSPSASNRDIQPDVKFLAIALILLVGSHALGGLMYARPIETERPIKIGIIQGNIPNDIKLFSTGLQRAMERYTRGYEQLADRGVDAILTPEGALPVFVNRLSTTPFYQALLNRGVVVWLGAYGDKPDGTSRLSYTNSLFTLTGTGKVVSRFDKVKLVPLGEYIPFEAILGKIIDRLSPLNAHMIPGSSEQIFETPFGKAIIGICYESAFSEHFRRQTARGGEFILTASNNAHYARSMPAQHHAQDVMRAIENDRWAARATNTGYSGIVDPRGRTLWRSEINTYEIYAATIDRRTTRTLYVRWGDWLTWGLLVSSAIALILYVKM